MSLFSLRRPPAAVAILLALAASWSARGAAQDGLSIEIRQVEIGFSGKYRSGFWTPIWMTLRSPQATAGRLEVLAPDGDGVPVAFGAAESTTNLPANEDKTIRVLAKIGPEHSSLSVRLLDPATSKVLWQGRFPAQAPKPLPAAWELVVSLGASPATEEAVGLVRRGEDQRTIAAAITDPARVPEDWWGWEGVETIVLPTSSGMTDRLSPAQWRALRQWLEIGGGRLVLCVGERGQTVLATGAPLADLVPGVLADVAALRDLDRLDELTGQPLAVTSDASRPLVAHLADARGRIESTVTGLKGEVPLMVRASRGMGEVVFLAVDPDGPALAPWAGRGRLLAPALNSGGRSTRAAETQRRSPSRLGYDDLSGQLRVALDVFPQVRVVNPTTVAVLTLVYLVLIGPLDYFLLRRLRRPAITWLSFPLVVSLFCAIGWYASRNAHGTAARANHCEIIDIDAETQTVRGTAWLHLYSPETSQYDVSLNVDRAPLGLSEPAHGWLAWQGLPGNGLGGLAANQLAAPTLVDYQASEPGPAPALLGIPIQIAGSKALTARWWSKCSIGRLPPLTLNDYGLLTGEVANPLPIELHECMLVYDEWMYRLKTLSPGERVLLTTLDPLNLEARLQHRTIANAKDVLSPWERDSVDVPRIVQMLMFHESARGSTYTNLAHRYQNYLDLTPRIRNGRAILVGRIKRPVARMELDRQEAAADSQAEPWTWVRIVIPVTPRARPTETP